MRKTEEVPFRLTPREIAVLKSLANTAGSDKMVAADLGLTFGSTKVYIYHIRQKLRSQGQDVKSRYDLITWAKENIEAIGNE